MVTFHLLKSYELGYDRAKYEIEALLGEQGLTTPSSIYFKQWMEQYSQ